MNKVTDEQVEREAASRWPALQPDDEMHTYSRSTLRAFCRAAFVQGVAYAEAGVAPAPLGLPFPLTPRAAQHWELSERIRKEFDGRGCVCELCELLLSLLGRSAS